MLFEPGMSCQLCFRSFYVLVCWSNKMLSTLYVTDCEYVWTNVSDVRSEGALQWYRNYDDVSGCQRACAEDVIGCVAVEYQPTTGSCWLQTNMSLVSQTTPAPGFVQYSLSVSCLPTVTGGLYIFIARPF